MGLLSFAVAEAVKHLMPFIACHAPSQCSAAAYFHLRSLAPQLDSLRFASVWVRFGFGFGFGSVFVAVLCRFGSVRLSSFLVLQLI